MDAVNNAERGPETKNETPLEAKKAIDRVKRGRNEGTIGNNKI